MENSMKENTKLYQIRSRWKVSNILGQNMQEKQQFIWMFPFNNLVIVLVAWRLLYEIENERIIDENILQAHNREGFC